MASSSTLGTIITDVSGLSAIGAGWYSALNPTTPIVVPGTPAQVAGQYAAITAQQQATLSANNPGLALLSSPSILFLVVIAAIVLIIVFRK